MAYIHGFLNWGGMISGSIALLAMLISSIGTGCLLVYAVVRQILGEHKASDE